MYDTDDVLADSGITLWYLGIQRHVMKRYTGMVGWGEVEEASVAASVCTGA